ncbi:unnamed protein product [Amoebophrya sp. A25]|nr:unnamed protein product [Amoebophrya sp. A25]|eukprot:GSA25T00015408001.1
MMLVSRSAYCLSFLGICAFLRIEGRSKTSKLEEEHSRRGPHTHTRPTARHGRHAAPSRRERKDSGRLRDEEEENDGNGDDSEDEGGDNAAGEGGLEGDDDIGVPPNRKEKQRYAKDAVRAKARHAHSDSSTHSKAQHHAHEQQKHRDTNTNKRSSSTRRMASSASEIDQKHKDPKHAKRGSQATKASHQETMESLTKYVDKLPSRVHKVSDSLAELGQRKGNTPGSQVSSAPHSEALKQMSSPWEVCRKRTLDRCESEEERDSPGLKCQKVEIDADDDHRSSAGKNNAKQGTDDKDEEGLPTSRTSMLCTHHITQPMLCYPAADGRCTPDHYCEPALAEDGAAGTGDSSDGDDSSTTEEVRGLEPWIRMYSELYKGAAEAEAEEEEDPLIKMETVKMTETSEASNGGSVENDVEVEGSTPQDSDGGGGEDFDTESSSAVAGEEGEKRDEQQIDGGSRTEAAATSEQDEAAGDGAASDDELGGAPEVASEQNQSTEGAGASDSEALPPPQDAVPASFLQDFSWSKSASPLSSFAGLDRDPEDTKVEETSPAMKATKTKKLKPKCQMKPCEQITFASYAGDERAIRAHKVRVCSNAFSTLKDGKAVPLTHPWVCEYSKRDDACALRDRVQHPYPKEYVGMLLGSSKSGEEDSGELEGDEKDDKQAQWDTPEQGIEYVFEEISSVSKRLRTEVERALKELEAARDDVEEKLDALEVAAEERRIAKQMVVDFFAEKRDRMERKLPALPELLGKIADRQQERVERAALTGQTS